MKQALLCVSALALIVPAAASAKTASAFLNSAIKGDNSEMRLGQLAMQRGGSKAVRDYGRTLHTDHMRARTKAVALARRDGVAVPQAMMPQAQAEYRKLDGMRGAAFDREFVRYMVRDHQKDIHDFEMQAKTGAKGTARLAQNTLPVLRKHLRIAKNLM